MSHEQTITVGIDGKHFNIVTVLNGKTVSDKQAIDFAIKNKSLGKAFNTQTEAIRAAIKRSESFNTGTGIRERKLK